MLSERSALLKQAHELQAQLAAALADQRHTRESLGACSPSAASCCSWEGSFEAAATPQCQLRQELLLAQVSLVDGSGCAVLRLLRRLLLLLLLSFLLSMSGPTVSRIH